MMDGRVVVTGAGGFIGGHLVRRLANMGIPVRAIDIKERSEWFQVVGGTEMVIGDLRQPDFASSAIDGCDIVFHLAADMGGMGFIAYNDVACLNGAVLDVNVANAAAKAGVATLLFTSSACVYPLSAQTPGTRALREQDAYPANPPEGYGWEKLYAERLFTAYADAGHFSVRLPRLHNVYGPHGAWRGGREKAPAALTRKVAAAQRLNQQTIPVWGTGREIRSYCYVHDAIEALVRLVQQCDYQDAVNVGSEQAISTADLVGAISEVAAWPVYLDFDSAGPTGVPSRNADTALAQQLIGWRATTPLKAGLADVYDEIYAKLAPCSEAQLHELAL